jgi:hypothetical protein
MSLRPRYSLLTLLILTALVAGGVKLWYGPHRVVLDPASASDQKQFTDLLMLVQLNQSSQQPADELSYIYRRRFGWKQEIECFVYSFKRPIFLVTGRYGKDDAQRIQFFLRSESRPSDMEILRTAAREPSKNDFEIELVEHVSFWIGGNMLKEPSRLGGHTSPRNKHGERVITPAPTAMYLGTSKGKIYSRKYGSKHLDPLYEAPFAQIELHGVEPSELQEYVAAEFARHR